MPTLLLFPILPNLLIAAFTFVWIYYGAFLASMGDYDAKLANFTDPLSDGLSTMSISGLSSSGSTSNNSALIEGYSIYNQTSTRISSFTSRGSTKTYFLLAYTLVFFWTTQFLHAIEVCTIAGAVSQWYWCADRRAFDHRPVWHSFCRTIRFHLGSLSYGSLIIGIIHMIRLFLSYLMHRTKGLAKHSRWVKLGMCCAACCLRCVERCGKYISSMAFIIVATKGKGFCRSTREAISLLISNFSRVSIVHTFSMILVHMGKMLVTILCTFVLCMLIMNSDSIPLSFFGSNLGRVSNPFFPMLACFFLAFTTSSYCCG